MTAKPLKEALAANRRLQKTISQELENIAERKHRNRVLAAQQTERLATVLLQQPGPSTPDSDNSSAVVSRHWTRCFFVDHNGKQPLPNEDHCDRRKDAEDWFAYNQPPFTKKESEIFAQLLAEQQEPDFDKVAEIFNQRPKVAYKRTAKECRVQYERLQQKKQPPFSKEEKKLLAQPSEDWDERAKELSRKSGRKRTSWDCLVEHHKQAKTLQTWTPQEDELLFKFIAAAGPQLAIDSKNPLFWTIFTNLLPNKSKRSILNRINTSLLNPSLRHGDWSHVEERSLVILMKIYKENPDDQMVLAASHLTGRAYKSVGDKWQRSLGPHFSSKPFTKSEDQELVETIRLHPDWGWSELSQHRFTHRHPQRLMNRFVEIATDQEIVQREKAVRKRRRR